MRSENSTLETEAHDFWSSSMDNPQIKDYSHWPGEGRWTDLAEWEKIGLNHLQCYRELCALVEKSVKGHLMIEWGPGGGSNILGFSPYFDKIYGVDISQANLDRCKDYMFQKGVENFVPVPIDISTPEVVKGIIESPLDFFLSTAVFQHFPSKDYGVKVLELAFDILKSGGLALIQTRYDNADPKFKSKNSNYSENVITFTSYTLDEFWGYLLKAGFIPLAVKLDPDVNYAFYLIKKP